MRTRLVRDGVTGFGESRPLPVFIDDQRQEDRPCDGYLWLGSHYDGFRNKITIQPVRRVGPRRLGALRPYMTVGQDYTISAGHYGIR